MSSAPPFENAAYLDRETGEVYYVSASGDPDELPGNVEEDDKYVSIPHKNDLDLGRELVFAFVAAEIPDEFESVKRIFSKKGAYARYKELLESKGRLEAWYGFEKQATEKAIRNWCEEEGIALNG